MRPESIGKQHKLIKKAGALAACLLCVLLFGLPAVPAYAENEVNPGSTDGSAVVSAGPGESAESVGNTENAENAAVSQEEIPQDVPDGQKQMPDPSGQAEQRVGSFRPDRMGLPDNGLDIRFSYGFQNTAKSGNRLPVNIQVLNGTDEPVSCTLEMVLSSGDGSIVRYIFDADTETKSVRDINTQISAADDVSEAGLRLYDRSGNLLAERNETISITGARNEMLIGLLSDDPQDLSYFRGIGLGGSQAVTRTVMLDPSRVSENEEDLSQLDVIIVSGFDMSELSAAASESIKAWVQSGGALLLGTGDVKDPLGTFGSLFPGIEIGAAVQTEVDMGMRFSNEGPDGAVLKLKCREIHIPQGIEAIQSGDLTVMVTVPCGSGTAGITVFDLCGIKDFCSDQMGYTAELLESLVGADRISRLMSSDAYAVSEFDRIMDMVSLPTTERMPALTLFMVFGISYVLLIGPGLFYFLKMRGLAVYYIIAVPAAACFGALVFWLASGGNSRGSALVNYAVIKEVSGDSSEERTFTAVVTGSHESLEYSPGENYTVMPVLRGSSEAYASDSAGSAGNAVQEGTGSVSGYDMQVSEIIVSDAGGTDSEGTERTLSVKAAKPFYSCCFESDGHMESAGGFEIKAAYDEQGLEGYIVNNTGADLENAVLLMYGRLAYIGEFKAGERIGLEDLSLIWCPVGSGSSIAEYAVEHSPVSEDRFEKLRKKRLLTYYIEDRLGYYFNGIYLAAFSENAEIPGAFDGLNADFSGVTMYTGSADMGSVSGGKVYRNVLSTSPKVINGSYERSSNLMKGGASAVLEYSLGSDINIEELSFNPLSESFENIWSGSGIENGNGTGTGASGNTGAGEAESASGMIGFRGTMSIYNYRKSGYETVDMDSMEFGEDTVKNYLSPSNTIIVRYTPDETVSAEAGMYLPVPVASGTGK